MRVFIFCVLLVFILPAELFCQLSNYRDDSLSSVQARREGIMDGNLVRTRFYNNGEVGQWPYSLSGEWPRGSGHGYLDGMTPLFAAEVVHNAKTFHPLESSYREFMDRDPSTGHLWGVEPVPGYFNPTSVTMATSTRPSSWPAVWPAALGLDDAWTGYWYGFFGRSVFYPSLEVFYVMDDANDEEFSRAPYFYHPIASDTIHRHGLGLRFENRMLQWQFAYIENAIFFHYDIVNLADGDYNKAAFGYYVDAGVGGTSDSEDDNANYNKQLDFVYAYDSNGLGLPNNWKTGYMAAAFLETPGNGTNGIDDDGDGMIDERRDDGIDNDLDWIPFTDLNNNGVWDSGEPIKDDVGMDGVGPGHQGYQGPDQGEGDGIPTRGEPNFDATDKDESDQIGLTAISIYKPGQNGTGGGYIKDDESMWLKLTSPIADTSIQRSNLSLVMGSSLFPLRSERRERYSTALLFANTLDTLIITKNAIQRFYNSNYDSTTVTGIEQLPVQSEISFELFENYPNPFNPSTIISYQLHKAGVLTVKVYDIHGKEIATLQNGMQASGKHELSFNGSKLASGTYLYQIEFEGVSKTGKMLLLK